MSVRRVREIARGAFFNRSGKNVAARDEQGAFALGAEAEGFDIVGRGNLRGAHGEGVGGNGDGDGLRLAAGDVVDIQLATGFINDLTFVVGAGPADVPPGAMRELVGLFRFDVVGVKIKRVVLVRGIEDFAPTHMGSRWARGS